MGRWLGIDHGTKRIGVAAGDTTDRIASPVEVIPASPQAGAIERIGQLAAEYQVDGIVVGWPLSMDDSEGRQGKLARTMASELARATGLDVRLWDERLSSFEADQALAGLLTSKKRKAKRDAIAAAAVLREFLSADGPASASRPDELTE